MKCPTDPEAFLKMLLRENRNLKKHLKSLVDMTTKVLRAIDAEMDLPSSPERGARIGRIMGALETAKDSARHFGLGEKL